MPVARLDEDDEVYRTQDEKYAAILAVIERAKQAAAAGAGRHHLDREVRSARRVCCSKHGYKQIDFGDPNALEKLYAAARAASRRRCSRC